MIDPAEKSDIQRLEDLLLDIKSRLIALEADQRLTQEWYTLRQAARLKRGTELRRNRKSGQYEIYESFYRTLKFRSELQPNRGIPDGKQGGVMVWHRDTILSWLKQQDPPISIHKSKRSA